MLVLWVLVLDTIWNLVLRLVMLRLVVFWLIESREVKVGLAERWLWEVWEAERWLAVLGWVALLVIVVDVEERDGCCGSVIPNDRIGGDQDLLRFSSG